MKKKHVEKAWGDNFFFYKIELKPVNQRETTPAHPEFHPNNELEATKIIIKFDGDDKSFYIMKADKGVWPGQREAIGPQLMKVLEYNYKWDEISGEDAFCELL